MLPLPPHTSALPSHVHPERGRRRRGERPVSFGDSHSFCHFLLTTTMQDLPTLIHIFQRGNLRLSQGVTCLEPHAGDAGSGLCVQLCRSPKFLLRGKTSWSQGVTVDGAKDGRGPQVPRCFEGSRPGGFEGSRAPSLAQRPLLGSHSGIRAHFTMAFCFQS